MQLDKMDLKLAEHRVLETARLKLRPLVLKDAADLYTFAGDPAVANWSGYPLHKSVEDTRQVIATVFMKQPLGKWGIEERASGRLIGSISLEDYRLNSFELGYQLSPTYQRRGYTIEAVRCVLDFAFKEVGVGRVWAQALVDNIPSRALLEKVGMKNEGTLRQTAATPTRGLQDFVHYSLLHSEYHPSVTDQK